MIYPFNRLLLLSIVALTIYSCGEDHFVPKPPTYLRTDFPEHTYKDFDEHCGYKFKLAKSYKAKEVIQNGIMTCHKDIDLGPLNGAIHLSYVEMIEPLSVYVNFANDRVDDHKIKADNIIDKNYIFPNKKVYGTFFELQGNVATPFQFYLTDSSKFFVRGEILMNSRPNYDSLKPTLDYLKLDLEKMIETFEWTK